MSTKWIVSVAAISILAIVAAGCSNTSAAPAPAAPSNSTPVAPAAAAGSTSTTGSTSQNGQNPGPQPNSANFASGQVKQISGNTIELTTANETMNVNVSDQTQIRKMGQGSMSDIQPGERLIVQGTRGDNGNVAAQTIEVGSTGGNQSGTPRPGRGTPGAGNAAGQNGQNGGRQPNPGNFVAGQVQQVNGNTIELTTANGSVTVDAGSQTQILKTSQGSLSDIQAGERISVQGTREADGSFTAQMIQIGGRLGGGNRQQPTPTPGAS